MSKKAKRWISSCYDGTYGCFINIIYGLSLIHYVASSLINAITGKGVIRAGKGKEGGFLPL